MIAFFNPFVFAAIHMRKGFIFEQMQQTGYAFDVEQFIVVL
jgi:hypothetical protein